MNTLVIVKSTDAIDGISPKQLRRIVFEIIEWLFLNTATQRLLQLVVTRSNLS